MTGKSPPTVFAHGRTGPLVIALHGGPGAPGSAAPWARELSRSFRVLEPQQRGSGGEPLTVARHVQDLHELILARGDKSTALIGHSWGAMLALAYAAEHRGSVAAVVLVGCGTFDQLTRERLQGNRESRMDASQRARFTALSRGAVGSESRQRKLAELLLPVDSVELVDGPHELGGMDARAHDETWADMLRLQETGIYPAAFSKIEVPVLMLHGSHDPHPGPLIRASLAPHVHRLEYVSLPRCGHYPWFERAGREEFFAIASSWLSRRLAAPAAWGSIVTSVAASESRAVRGASAES